MYIGINNSILLFAEGDFDFTTFQAAQIENEMFLPKFFVIIELDRHCHSQCFERACVRACGVRA